MLIGFLEKMHAKSFEVLVAVEKAILHLLKINNQLSPEV
jgi:hypothetical protein